MQYALLAIAFSLAVSYQIFFSTRLIESREHEAVEPLPPFALRLDTDRFASVEKALADAGLQPGDELLQVEDQPYRGLAQISHLLAIKRPGDQLTIKVLRQGHTEPETLGAPLVAAGTGQHSILSWVSFVVKDMLTPVFCLLLGFGVAAVRPRDPLAWLLLAMMLSFSYMVTGGETSFGIPLALPVVLRTVAILLHTFFIMTWSIWILIFGIYFPERLSLDRRAPWVKWIIIGPVGINAIGSALSGAAEAENYRLFTGLQVFLVPLGNASALLQMAAISGFFFSIGTKIGEESTPDAKRRLNLLINGSGVAFTPMFILVVYALISGGGFRDFGSGIWIPCILMMALFPITLAYVIVVHRALDVRVVIRQGIRYALARRGVVVLQVLVSAAVIFAALTLATDPARNRPQKIQMLGFGLTALVLIRRGTERVRRAVDRRFFREAYNTETILSELSDQVRTMVETRPLLETVAQRISASLHVPKVAMLVKQDGRYHPEFAVGYDSPPEADFEEAAGTVAQIKRSREPLRVYFDDPDSWIYREAAVSEADRAGLQKLEAQLLLPLAFKDKLVGFMSLSAKQSEEPYSKTDVQLLESVAMQTGLALENSQLTAAIAAEVAQRERLNRDLEIAREVQERLFPQKYPVVAGLDIAGHCRPAQGVGGDYYDFLDLPDGCLGIGIGDISGKGIPAALLMASLQASLRGQTIGGTTDLAKLMTNVNRLIYEASPSNRYATFFYSQYEPATRRLTYVNGGHNAPMILRDGGVLRLEEGGPVVGLFKPSRYSQASIDLQPGDVMVLFTDGISEAMNPQDDEWGEERLIEAVKVCRDHCAAQMIDELMREADAFAAGAPQHDDMTIMIVKVL